MSKSLTIGIIPLIALILTAAYPPAHQKHPESDAAESTYAEPSNSKMPRKHAAEHEPEQNTQDKANPEKTRPAKPAKTEPAEATPAETEPNQTEPSEPAETGPVETGSSPGDFHDKCAYILNNFVDANGTVDYTKLRRKKPRFYALLYEFSALEPEVYNAWPEKEKIAFWINAYNIHRLKIIANNYPIKSYYLLHAFWGPYSVRHINKRIGGIDKQKFIIMDEEFTLEEIEDRFFRTQFDEPRAFLALFHATRSGPPLRNEPYRGEKLNEQLDDQAKKFLTSPLAFRIDRNDRQVHLSTILEPTWFGREFVTSYGIDRKFKDHPTATRAVLNFITNYTSQQDKDFLETAAYSIRYIKYDWTINDALIQR